MNANCIPKPSSLQDAVDIIRATLPEEELQAWAAQPESSAEVLAHFGLGTWIRSNWVHGAGSPLAVRITEVVWFIHGDEISTMVVKALWRVLNGLPCPSIEELLSPVQLRYSRGNMPTREAHSTSVQCVHERMNGNIEDTR